MKAYKHCQRCGNSLAGSIMSRFNTEIICLECEEWEKLHPDYAKAVEGEAAAVRRGKKTFQGIGRPRDL